LFVGVSVGVATVGLGAGLLGVVVPLSTVAVVFDPEFPSLAGVVGA